MVLSIVIVNYNVRFFLEQNLRSVQAAARGPEYEVIVIDNHSTDNSIAYLQPLFPEVRFISNSYNAGFGKACNQGLAISRGEFILFLNPDTIVGEESFRSCIAFFKSHPDAGAIGVKMLDGRGRFLKESKRAFPSPLTSFYKLAGLARLFPRSRIFSNYHLGYLDENKDHRVEVLSGAYLMAAKKVLDITGGFDEQFFMYGEDIDLSYRIRQAGFANYYFAGAPIIHFKGESTRKASANYVRMFYQAMSIFVRKHYGRPRARFFNASIQFAIGVRGILSAIAGFIKHAGMPLIDGMLILLCFTAAKAGWNHWVRPSTDYDPVLVGASFGILTVVYLLVAYYAGLYDRTYRTENLRRTATAGILIVLSAYSLLPEDLRFSRAIVLLGSILSFAALSLVRRLFLNTGILVPGRQPGAGLVFVIGNDRDQHEVSALLGNQPGVNLVNVSDKVLKDRQQVDWIKLRAMIGDGPRSGELVYCVGHLPVSELISQMGSLPKHIRLHIHYSESGSMVGSDSANRSGNALSADDRFRIGKPFYRRWKRLIDLTISTGSLLTFPIHLLLVGKPLVYLERCVQVLTGTLTWVGYGSDAKGLPVLRRGILTPDGPVNMRDEQYATALDTDYAETYSPRADLKLLLAFYRKLGS